MFALIELILIIAVAAGAWKTYEKAGRQGWEAIVPIYNAYVMLEIIGKPWWWLLLLLVPFVNIIIAIIVYVEFAKKFGQGALFGIGLLFLSFIFFPILGFGDAKFQGGSNASPITAL